MFTMDPVSNALLGAAFGELFKAVRHTITVMNRSSCKELESKLQCLCATIDEAAKVASLNVDSPPQCHHAWVGFQKKLHDGVALAKKCQRIGRCNLFAKYRYGRQIGKLEKDITDFMQTQGLADVVLGVNNANLVLQNQSQLYEGLEDIMVGIGTKMTMDANENSLTLRQIMKATDQLLCNDRYAREACDFIQMQPADQAANSSFHVPDTPNPMVGFDIYLSDLKRLVFRSDVNVIGVTGMGGRGKTTLALALCNDPELKGFFENTVIFITVSQKPNVMGILETMWDRIVGERRPGFQNEEDARYQLQTQLRERQCRPTLVVLDDVWSRSDLESLLFKGGERYKTLVTTRDCKTIPKEHSEGIYSLPLLKESDALSLFCFWAFGQPTIPNTEDENLVKLVQAECKGLPLALKVIGSSLHGEPRAVWESAKNKLLRAESLGDYYKRGVLDRLETSIDVLDDELRQCFLDLGGFPEDREVPADALLHIWVYVRGMEWHDAFFILLELASRNLLNLTSYPGSRAMSYDCGCELFVSQHDVMRDLALALANKDNEISCKRFFMPRKENGIPKKWLALRDRTAAAQIVSIHTGPMDEEQWCEIDFPRAEALILFFAAAEYHLPPFLDTMKRLKVLMIYNYSSKRATLNGLGGFLSLTQIKTIQLERLKIPPLLEYCKSFESLEKLSVSLCEGLDNMTKWDMHLIPNFPKLVEVIVDHCSDLEELPMRMCDLTSLQTLSVTNCHLLRKLPNDLGRLSELRLLRLSACPKLATLPGSICKLGKLELLDISLCGSLKELPGELDGLSMLKKLDVRECFGLRVVPKTIGNLRSLRLVVCDERSKQRWLSINGSPDIKVEVVDEFFSTDLYTTNRRLG